MQFDFSHNSAQYSTRLFVPMHKNVYAGSKCVCFFFICRYMYVICYELLYYICWYVWISSLDTKARSRLVRSSSSQLHGSRITELAWWPGWLAGWLRSSRRDGVWLRWWERLWNVDRIHNVRRQREHPARESKRANREIEREISSPEAGGRWRICVCSCAARVSGFVIIPPYCMLVLAGVLMDMMIYTGWTGCLICSYY